MEQVNQAFLNLSYELPKGYRFQPLDSELIINYLKPKINGYSLPINHMHEVNIYNYNPDYLAENYKPQGENIWYFFTSRDKKYPNGSRPNRKAGDGYWKASEADKVVRNHEGQILGMRKSLVFYHEKVSKSQKTPWIMHEYIISDPPQVNTKTRNNDSMEGTSMRLDDCVLCKIYKKKVKPGQNQGNNSQVEESEQQVQPLAVSNECITSYTDVIPQVTNPNRTPILNPNLNPNFGLQLSVASNEDNTSYTNVIPQLTNPNRIPNLNPSPNLNPNFDLQQVQLLAASNEANKSSINVVPQIMTIPSPYTDSNINANHNMMDFPPTLAHLEESTSTYMTNVGINDYTLPTNNYQSSEVEEYNLFYNLDNNPPSDTMLPVPDKKFDGDLDEYIATFFS